MSWGELPILPLRRVYQCLPIRDCLAASSCCKNWRYAFQFHRIQRDQLCLKAQNNSIEKNIFLVDFFGRYAKELNVILASSVDDYSTFFDEVLSRFYDSDNLISIKFMPTIEYFTFEKTHNKEYVQKVFISPLLKLCKLRTIKGININGCSELMLHVPALLQSIAYPKHYQYLGLAKLWRTSFTDVPLNLNLFHNFTSLKYLSLDYGSVSEELLMGIRSEIPSLEKLILNITSVPPCGFLDMTSAWLTLRMTEYKMFTVTINCIHLTGDIIVDVNRYVLCEGMPLEALRVMFCKNINLEMLRKLAYYNETFKELVWVDSIVVTDVKNTDGAYVNYKRFCRGGINGRMTNPLVMMCWQCPLLEKITIHGYWHSAHDLLGMARLRGNSLRTLNISSLLQSTRIIQRRQNFAPAVLTIDEISRGPALTTGFLQDMSRALRFIWNEPMWNKLHPSLKGERDDIPSLAQEYVIKVLRNDIPHVDEI